MKDETMQKDIHSINRSIAIIRPAEPFIDWVNSLPDNDQKFTTEDFKDDCTAVLIPEYDSNEDAKLYISTAYEALFDNELESWCLDEDLWPKNRNQKMFWQWFIVEFHSMILDPLGDDITREAI